MGKPQTDAQRKYAEMLKDPRWKARREEILQRDNYTCRGCGSKEPEKFIEHEDGYREEVETEEGDRFRLEVHHKLYEWGRKPWEYGNEYLITLCEYCHDIETVHVKQATEELVEAVRTRFLSRDISRLAHAIRFLQMPFAENKRSSAIIAWALTEPAVVGFLQELFESRNKELKPASSIVEKMIYPLHETARG